MPSPNIPFLSAPCAKPPDWRRLILRQHLPRFAERSDDEILTAEVTLHDAQHVTALRYGFANWAALSATVAERNGTRSARGRPRLRVFEELDEKLRSHIETLGFATVGAYRIWCHKEGFGSGLDKSDAQLYEELVRHQQEPPRPVLRRDYRPAEERKITRAYRGEVDGLWHGWKRPFEGVEDADEREALYRLLVHCTFVSELANGWVGYVPTRKAFAENMRDVPAERMEKFDHMGYEVRSALSRGFLPGVGEAMADAAVRLLEQVAGS